MVAAVVAPAVGADARARHGPLSTSERESERESEHEREEGKRSFVKEKTKLSIYLFGWIPTRSGRSKKEAEQKPDKVRQSRRISFR